MSDKSIHEEEEGEEYWFGEKHYRVELENDEAIVKYLETANLVAAAPELLEALVDLSQLEVKGHSILDRLQFSETGRALAAKVTAAIMKAKGEL